MLCVPVFDVDGQTIAVIQAINKVEHGMANSGGLHRRSTISKGEMFHDLHIDCNSNVTTNLLSSFI